MAWFYVDDGFSDSKPVMNMPGPYRLAACGLWVLAGSWSAKEETDGVIPENMLRQLLHQGFDNEGRHHRPHRRHGPIVRALTEGPAPLCRELDGGGIALNAWSKWQRTRAERAAKRQQNAERQAEYRQRSGKKPATKSKGRYGATSEDPSGVTRYESVSNALVAEPSTHPTPPHPITSSYVDDVSEASTHAPNASNARARSDPTFELATTDTSRPLSRPVGIGASRLVATVIGNRIPNADQTILRIKASELLSEHTEDDVAECLRVWFTKTDLGPHALACCMTEVYKRRNTNGGLNAGDRKVLGYLAMTINNETPTNKGELE